MYTSNRWKELLLSLAAGPQMVPGGDNGAALRRLSERIWMLRAAEAAARAAASAAQRSASPRGVTSTRPAAAGP